MSSDSDSGSWETWPPALSSPPHHSPYLSFLSPPVSPPLPPRVPPFAPSHFASFPRVRAPPSPPAEPAPGALVPVPAAHQVKRPQQNKPLRPQTKIQTNTQNTKPHDTLRSPPGLIEQITRLNAQAKARRDSYDSNIRVLLPSHSEPTTAPTPAAPTQSSPIPWPPVPAVPPTPSGHPSFPIPDPRNVSFAQTDDPDHHDKGEPESIDRTFAAEQLTLFLESINLTSRDNYKTSLSDFEGITCMQGHQLPHGRLKSVNGFFKKQEALAHIDPSFKQANHFSTGTGFLWNNTIILRAIIPTSFALAKAHQSGRLSVAVAVANPKFSFITYNIYGDDGAHNDPLASARTDSLIDAIAEDHAKRGSPPSIIIGDINAAASDIPTRPNLLDTHG